MRLDGSLGLALGFAGEVDLSSKFLFFVFVFGADLPGEVDGSFCFGYLRIWG